MRHEISNTPSTLMIPPKESLIPSHLFLRNVRPKYHERVQEVEELRSTTDLRWRLEARREIRELNKRLQEEERRREVNLKDKLSKQRELTEIDKKWENMQAKMDAMEKQVMIEGAYVNLKMLWSSPFTQKVDKVHAA